MSETDGGENHAEQDTAGVTAATHIARLRRRWFVRAEHADEIWGNLDASDGTRESTTRGFKPKSSHIKSRGLSA